MKPAKQSMRRVITAMACSLIGVLGVTGCAPLVSVAGAAISQLAGGGSSAAPAASGAFGIGAPTLAQNAHTMSPVQNHKPTEQAIQDVLDHADNQAVRDSCLEKLAPEMKAPVTACVTRLSCIPGLSQPLMMRTCPANTTVAQVSDQPRKSVAPNAGPAWRWETN